MIDGVNNTNSGQSISDRLGIGGTAGDVIDAIAEATGLDKLLGGDSGLNQLNAKPDTLQRFAPANGGEYTVKRGDTLDSIAKANGTSWQELKALNPQISNANLIRPGQKIALPANSTQNYTVRSGDTLSAIATRFGTTPQAIKDANPKVVENVNRIYPGEQLRIPVGVGAQTMTPTAKPTVTKVEPQVVARTDGKLTPDATSLRAADMAERAATGHPSKGQCYAWVKRALQNSGAVPVYLQGVPAKGAGPQLEKYGFVNVLGKPGYDIKSPYDAPKGAVLVYGAAPTATDKNAKYGHIEIRTANGFASDYVSARARTGGAENGLVGTGPKARVLIGVYIKPAASTVAQPTVPTGGQAAPANQKDLIAKLGSVITIGEGNYESYNTGTKGVKDDKVGHSYLHPKAGTVTNMTINQIIATEGLSGYNTSRMFATGKYQTTIGTLKLAKEAMGLTGNERYTPEMQERVFREFLLDKAGGGVLAAFVRNGKGTVDQAQYAASKEWASIAVPAGMKNKYGIVSDGNLSYYQKAGQNAASSTATRELRALLISIDKGR